MNVALKVYVITKNVGYGDGDAVMAVRLTPDSVTAWLTDQCGHDTCLLRHDRWCAELPPMSTSVPSHEAVITRLGEIVEWSKQFCRTGDDYEIEEFEAE